ncbi:DUF4232 domain-containing protein [Streptomyces calidiresistens]|uniref:DUF4232 domain-containing protein n=1 Tax=Streptomyces calidiresistens TaxID=1485586 RepID=A0A7W3XXC7_9ACTN|nr:DUF4232 domain-containing protein [Streptomyces calidiresistens]MBB0230662.1 DUF4232 domain-containing protein [Streptomyces calidiresistens]
MSRNRTLSRGLVAAGLTAASLALAACQSGSDVSSPGGGTAVDRSAPVVEESPVEDTAAGENTAEDTPAEGAASDSGAPAAGATKVPAEGTDAGETAPVPVPRENGPSAVPAGDRRGKEDGSRTGKDVPVLPACTPSTTKLTVAPVSRPVNHLLLTVTNTGNTACAPYNHPYLRFDGGQSVMQVVRSSIPQAVVVLEPGESAYAGIRTSSADDSNVRPVEGLEVFLTDRNGRTVGNAVTLPVPAGTAEGASAAVTYWQSDRADALMW